MSEYFKGLNLGIIFAIMLSGLSCGALSQFRQGIIPYYSRENILGGATAQGEITYCGALILLTCAYIITLMSLKESYRRYKNSTLDKYIPSKEILKYKSILALYIFLLITPLSLLLISSL